MTSFPSTLLLLQRCLLTSASRDGQGGSFSTPLAREHLSTLIRIWFTRVSRGRTFGIRHRIHTSPKEVIKARE
ncbi:hypothetical protein CPB85DRAFT_1320961 [Mucidula mucida]|nr:hypothetical protein CPB85DRAFT_1322387 [Mucidula mucida]KAF8902840.1 hypothetical protein CPB85DRAFT_1320961 [Mucidula mucida]